MKQYLVCGETYLALLRGREQRCWRIEDVEGLSRCSLCWHSRSSRRVFDVFDAIYGMVLDVLDASTKVERFWEVIEDGGCTVNGVVKIWGRLKYHPSTFPRLQTSSLEQMTHLSKIFLTNCLRSVSRKYLELSIYL